MYASKFALFTTSDSNLSLPARGKNKECRESLNNAALTDENFSRVKGFLTAAIDFDERCSFEPFFRRENCILTVHGVVLAPVEESYSCGWFLQ